MGFQKIIVAVIVIIMHIIDQLRINAAEKIHDIDDTDANRFLPNSRNGSPCENASLICENVPNYPEKHINELIERESLISPINAYQNEDELDVRFRYDDYALCPYRIQVLHPRVAQNLNGTWTYIFNGDNYRQGIKTETCIYTGNTCAYIESNIQNQGFSSKCVQKDLEVKLFGLDENGNAMIDFYKVPSYCQCTLKRNEN